MGIVITFDKDNIIKQAPLGFSWTVLFFGFCAPLTRGDAKWTLIMFILGFFTFGITSFIFPFIYNKIYIQSLLENGYKPDEIGRGLLIKNGILRK
ncbi:MAG: hypothetical protein LBC92_05565 [Rickettsiales bacterium]|jgi:hypothetical protein|nr:hypothetical protein [Rickettsiales bacterium]